MLRDADFAANMRERRRALGLSQAVLAAELTKLGFSVPASTVHRMENHDRKVSIGEAILIAEALGSTIDDLSRWSFDAATETPEDRLRASLDALGDAAEEGRVSDVAALAQEVAANARAAERERSPGRG